MAYEPKGKIAVLLDAMRTRPADVLTSAEVAAVMGVEPKQVAVYTSAAVSHGALHRKLENGRCSYALHPFPAWAPPKMAVPREGSDRLHVNPPAAAAPAPIEVRTPPPSVEPEEPEEAAPFNAALWADGDLIIYGAQENEDGSITLRAPDVAAVKRLLSGVPA